MEKNKNIQKEHQHRIMKPNDKLEKIVINIIVFCLTVGAVLLAGRYFEMRGAALIINCFVVNAMMARKNFFKIIVSLPYLVIYILVILAVVFVPFPKDILYRGGIGDTLVYGGYAVFCILALICLIVVKVQKRRRE